MESLLNDARKFKKDNLKNDGILSFLVNQGKHVDNIFKKLVTSNSISEETARKLVGTSPNIMYELCSQRHHR